MMEASGSCNASMSVKRPKLQDFGETPAESKSDPFEKLPDELVLKIIRLASTKFKKLKRRKKLAINHNFMLDVICQGCNQALLR